MKKTFWSASIFIALIVSTLNTACSDKYERENQLLDSLDMSLEASEARLELEMDVIKKRILELQEQQSGIIEHHQDTFSYELAQKMGKQRALLKLYKRSVSDHSFFAEELPLLRTQVANLREDLNNGLLDKAQFKEYYQKERNDIAQLEWNTEALKRDLYQMEPVYQRLAPELDLVLENLMQRDSL